MAATAANLDFHPRRGKARLRLGIPAAFITVNGRQEISLLDLSQSGARLRVDDSEPVGRGILKWMDFEAFGSVVRRNGKDIGLQFEEPIESDWVLDTKEWLPEVPRAKDELRQFARDWVRGRAPRKERTQTFGTRGQASARHPVIIAPGPDLVLMARPTAIDWCRAGAPFIFGGVLLGAIAGFCSSYF